MNRRFAVVFLAALLAACGGGGQDSHLEGMAREHEGDRPVASGAAERAPAQPVVGEEVVYNAESGTRGYLARPESAEPGAPAILLIHEWWGLNDNIRSVARQFAGEGYTALAVDLYGGQVADTPERARELATSVGQNPAPAEADLKQAHAFLRGQGAERIGVVGWCFGGGWSLRTGLLLGDAIDATVIYYGRLVTDPAELEPLRSPVLGLFGAEDGGIPVDSVRAFEAALAEAGKTATIQVYEGAGHAFANPSGTRYNAEAADDAWSRTLAFFAQHLSDADE